MKFRYRVTLVAVCILVAISLLIPMISYWRDQSRKTLNSGRLSEYFAAFHLAGRSYYPGLSHNGRQLTFPGVRDRFIYLLDENYISPEALYNPADLERLPSAAAHSGARTAQLIRYSYAMLQIDVGFDGSDEAPPIGRRAEWRATWNSRAALMADRYMEVPGNATGASAWRMSGWCGHVLWNDGTVRWQESPYAMTHYDGVTNLLLGPQSDHLFERGYKSFPTRDSISDAYLIDEGQ